MKYTCFVQTERAFVFVNLSQLPSSSADWCGWKWGQLGGWGGWEGGSGEGVERRGGGVGSPGQRV